MSEGSTRDIIELSVRFGELKVTIAGPAGPATQLLQDITSRSSTGSAVVSPRGSEHSFAVVPETPPSQTRSAAQGGAYRSETRWEIGQSFPDLPEPLRVLGRRLDLSGEERVQRAWTAGCWAGAVLGGRIQTPSRTPPCQLRWCSDLHSAQSLSAFPHRHPISRPLGICETVNQCPIAGPRRRKPKPIVREQALFSPRFRTDGGGSRCRRKPGAVDAFGCWLGPLRGPVGVRVSTWAGLRVYFPCGDEKVRGTAWSTSVGRHHGRRARTGCVQSSARSPFGTFGHYNGARCAPGGGWQSRRGGRGAWGSHCRLRRVHRPLVVQSFRGGEACVWFSYGGGALLPKARGSGGNDPRMASTADLGGSRPIFSGGHCRKRWPKDTSKKAKEARYGFSFRKGKAASKAKEGNYGITSPIPCGSHGNLASDDKSDAGPSLKTGVPGEADGAGGPDPSAAGSALGGKHVGAVKAVVYEGGSRFVAESTKDRLFGPSYLVFSSSDGPAFAAGVGEGKVPRRWSDFGPGNVGPVFSDHNFGCADSWRASGSLSRPLTLNKLLYEGFGWQSTAAAGVGYSPRGLLQCGGALNGKANESHFSHSRCLPSDTLSPRHFRGQVSGEVRWVREARDRGSFSISSSGPGLHDEREPPSCKGHSSPHSGDAGAGVSGLWSVRDCTGVSVDGGSPSGHLHEQADCHVKISGLRSLGRTEMDHCDFGLSEGVGPDHYKEAGVHPRKLSKFCRWRWPRLCEVKAETKEEGKREGHGGRGGVVASHQQGDALELLSAETTVSKWLITLPRFILATRCSFAWHLRRSFSVCTRASSSITTAFPLPAPFLGCFMASGPRLSAKRLLVVGQKRLVHMMVLILNKLYLGRYASLEELRRPPSPLQNSIFRRLYGLAAVCGKRPGNLPVPPGRSGPELIASLAALERFLETDPNFGSGYFGGGGGKQAFEAPTLDVEQFPQLQPYRSLDAGRLKLTGTGEWPLADFLDSELWLPFVEPRFLLRNEKVEDVALPTFTYEKPEEYLKLAQKWDSLGLLRLYEAPLLSDHFSRIFNAFKNSDTDRQIGDRRIPNARERGSCGPSAYLPPGPMLTALQVKRGSHSLRCSMTDRRDFYHQAAVTPMRARSNMTPFAFPISCFEGTRALDLWKKELGSQGKQDRCVIGDLLDFPDKKKEAPPEKLFPCFGALYQGDHLGVEFALDAHQGLLVQESLLAPERRLLNRRPLPLGGTWEALIIDDYFCISSQPRSWQKEKTDAFESWQRAKEAYKKHCLPGSDEKDVVAETFFKAAGAEVDSSDQTLDLGLATCGAPLAKRLGLASVSLRAAKLGAISSGLASRLAGSWVSVLLYRRCLASLVEKFFAVAADGESRDRPTIMPLSRDIADELVALAVMSPAMVTDVSAPILQDVFATDASMSRGAVVSTSVPEEVARILWLGGDKRGKYTMLDNPFRAALKHLGEEPEEEHFAHSWTPQKPLTLRFDFVEIFGGSGRVSDAMNGLGFVVAPVLDLSYSRAYDVGQAELMRWIFHMIDSEAFGSILLAPPCTTFSPAAYPAVRSYKEPKGWNRSCPKVLQGNLTAFRSLVIFKYSRRKKKIVGLEQSRRSKMAWLAEWRSELSSGAEEAVVASCQFGSIHQKEFRFLLYGIAASSLDRRCSRDHRHVKIQGKFTKASAIYTVDLAMHIAKAYAEALRARVPDDVEWATGLESVLANDVLTSFTWKLVRVWCWKAKSHINVLEAGAVCSLLKDSLECRPDSRFSVLIDSQVAKGALAKGRSSARALQPVLCRCAALQISGGLQPAYGFAPTRLNTADHPTREKDFENPVEHSIIDFCSTQFLQKAHGLGLSRAGANWIRLVALASCVQLTAALDFLQTPRLGLCACWIFGFLCLLGLSCLFLSLITTRGPRGSNSFRPLVILACVLAIVEAPIAPESAAEQERAQQRTQLLLVPDLVVRPQTRSNRLTLLGSFKSWVQHEMGLDWIAVFESKPYDPELMADCLVKYGQELYSAGKTYQRYAETINALVAQRPIIKRQLTKAWDLAFAWVQDEPCRHHPAMPATVLLSMVTVALMWGWLKEAALWALAWAGILRVGEVIMATRADLILPSDGVAGTNYILLRIKEPKTRGRGPRHQAARIDPQDLVQLIQVTFKDEPPQTKLWPWSASTLRKRFNAVQKELGLPLKPVDGSRPYELASLRAGGATWLLQKTELPELVRRRGRWQAFRTMEVYLQEVVVTMSMSHVEKAVIQKIQTMAEVFPLVLEKVTFLCITQVPPRAWFFLFTAREAGSCGGKNGN